jgi:hypothetical protein
MIEKIITLMTTNSISNPGEDAVTESVLEEIREDEYVVSVWPGWEISICKIFNPAS